MYALICCSCWKGHVSLDRPSYPGDGVFLKCPLCAVQDPGWDVYEISAELQFHAESGAELEARDKVGG